MLLTVYLRTVYFLTIRFKACSGSFVTISSRGYAVYYTNLPPLNRKPEKRLDSHDHACNCDRNLPGNALLTPPDDILRVLFYVVILHRKANGVISISIHPDVLWLFQRPDSERSVIRPGDGVFAVRGDCQSANYVFMSLQGFD
jgi:hypothetical protein